MIAPHSHYPQLPFFREECYVMSTATLPAAGDFDDFDRFLEFAAVTRGFDRDDLPEPDADLPPLERRRPRRADRRAAIDKSLRDAS